MDDHQRKMWAAMLGEIGEYRAVGGLADGLPFRHGCATESRRPGDGNLLVAWRLLRVNER